MRYYICTAMIFRVLMILNAVGVVFIALVLVLGKQGHGNELSNEELDNMVAEVVEQNLPQPKQSELDMPAPPKPVKPFTEEDVHKLLLQRTMQKKEINISGLRPELDTAGIIVVNVFHEIMGDEYVPLITSANDYAHHKKTSAHYRNLALDFRIKGIPMYKKQKITKLAKVTLGNRFFVQHESPGGEMEHLHIELRDPSRNWNY